MSKYWEQYWREESELNSGFTNKFEYCMVFPLEDTGDVDPRTGAATRHQTKMAKHCITLMLQQGMDVFTYPSVQGDEIYVLISANDAVLGRFADKIDFKMALSEKVCQEKMEKGNPEKQIAPVFIKDDSSITPYSPYMHLYGKFDSDVDLSIYHVPFGETSPFTKTVKLKLLYYMIKGPLRDGGCDLEVNRMLLNGSLLAFFPLHNLDYLYGVTSRIRSWTSMPWNQPLDEMREYFGEKFALYNAFLGHFTYYLIIPAIIGLAFQIEVWKTGNLSHPVMPFFAVVITFWSVSMLETWKGQQATLAMRWGMLGFEDEEPDRPEFVGIPTTSHINGKEIVYFPKFESFKRFTLSAFSIMSYILLCIGVVGSIYYLRFAMQKNSAIGASALASVLNTVQITIFNAIYQKIVTKLTDLENHRTDTQYEDSLIGKLFCFQFVNSYASFFYIAFLAQWLQPPPDAASDLKGQCGDVNCMLPLAMNLAIVFGTRLVVTNFAELLVPLISFTDRREKEIEGIEDITKVTPAEDNFMRLKYDAMYDSIKNYADTTILFGYMCLFVAALPIACLFSIINSFGKIRINATNMLRFYQRPIPLGAEDIGSWQAIFTLMAVISVITNAAIVCFTMDIPVFDEYTPVGKLWIFIGFQWVIIGFQYLLIQVIPDVPDAVQIQQKRESFISDKLISLLPDDDYNKVFGELEDAPTSVAAADFTNKVICCCLNQPKPPKIKIRETNESDYPMSTYPFYESDFPDQKTGVNASGTAKILGADHVMLSKSASVRVASVKLTL